MSRKFIILLGVVMGLLMASLRVDGQEKEPTPSEKAVKQLEQESGVKIEQDGIGRQGGRDIDTKDMSGTDVKKVENAAENKGYKVEKRAESTTISGKSKDGVEIKETTLHRKAGVQDAAGSSSLDAQNMVNDPEHFKGRPDPKTGKTRIDSKTGLVEPTVADIVSKTSTQNGKPLPGEHPLTKDPSKMTQTDLENAAKMTDKAMKVGKVQNPELQTKIDAIRNGKTPAEAGIDNPAEFQKQCQNEVTKAVQNENKQIQNERTELNSEFKQAEKNLNDAKAGGDPKEIAKAKSEFQDVKGRAIKYDSSVNGAQQKAINNGADEVYAKANGYEKTTTPEGKTQYVDPKTGEAVPNSKMVENITKGKNVNLRTAPTEPGVPPGGVKPVSTGTKIGGGIVLLYGAYHGAQQGSELAVEQEQPGDSTIKTVTKATIYGTASTLGIVQADEIGEDTAKATVHQWNQDVKDGKISDEGLSGSIWKLWYAGKAGLEAGGTQAKKLVEAIIINPLYDAKTAIDEGIDLENDRQNKEANEKEAQNVEQKLQDKKEQKKKDESGGWEDPGVDPAGWDRINKVQDTATEKPPIPSGKLTPKKPQLKVESSGIDIAPPDWDDGDEDGVDNQGGANPPGVDMPAGNQNGGEQKQPAGPYDAAIQEYGTPAGWLGDGRPYWGTGDPKNPFTDHGIPNPNADVNQVEQPEEDDSGDESVEDEPEENGDNKKASGGILDEVTPVRVTATGSFSDEKSTTTMTFTFWNVGSLAPGYGDVTLTASYSAPDYSETTTSKGTFSGGPSGTMSFDDMQATLANGSSFELGGGIRATVNNPDAFQNWPKGF